MIEQRLDRLQAMMERMLGAMLRLASPHCSAVDLTPQQYMLLRLLDDEGPLSLSALRERTRGAQSTLSEMIARMARSGLVSKRRDATDRRAVRIAVTATARTLMRERAKEFRARSALILSALSLDEQERYLEAVETLVTLIERAVARDGAGEDKGR
jgi:DNA-binding MarR family transcriptional regulator